MHYRLDSPVGDIHSHTSKVLKVLREGLNHEKSGCDGRFLLCTKPWRKDPASALPSARRTCYLRVTHTQGRHGSERWAPKYNKFRAVSDWPNPKPAASNSPAQDKRRPELAIPPHWHLPGAAPAWLRLAAALHAPGQPPPTPRHRRGHDALRDPRLETPRGFSRLHPAAVLMPFSKPTSAAGPSASHGRAPPRLLPPPPPPRPPAAPGAPAGRYLMMSSWCPR